MTNDAETMVFTGNQKQMDITKRWPGWVENMEDWILPNTVSYRARTTSVLSSNLARLIEQTVLSVNMGKKMHIYYIFFVCIKWTDETHQLQDVVEPITPPLENFYVRRKTGLTWNFTCRRFHKRNVKSK